MNVLRVENMDLDRILKIIIFTVADQHFHPGI